MRLKFSKEYFFYSILLFLTVTTFVIVNYLVGGGMFVHEVDGFYTQMNAVSSGVELGSLEDLHKVRYYLIFPFYYFSEFPLIQGLLLSIYISPIFFLSGIPVRVKILSIVVFILPLFFSYRSVITMVSLYILILCILWPPQSTKYIFISFIYSSLSTGSFLGLIFIFLCFRKQFLTTIWKRILIYTVVLASMVIFLGSIVHKALFFIDPDEFGSAAGVNLSRVIEFDEFSVSKLLIGIFERGMLYISYSDDKLRFSIVLVFLVLSLIFLAIDRSRLALSIFTVYSFGCFVEGLMSFSLILAIFVLFFYYGSIRIRFMDAKSYRF